MADKEKKFVAHSTEEKKEFAKKFSKTEVAAYRKGKRAGFLNGIHTDKKKA